MAVGPIEPKFYAIFLDRLGLAAEDLPSQNDDTGWSRLQALIGEAFLFRTRADWEEVFAGSDACVSPVLSLPEAPVHPHARARDMFVKVEDIDHPRPAPRLSRTPGSVRRNAPWPGQDTAAIVRELGTGDTSAHAGGLSFDRRATFGSTRSP